MMHLRHPRVTWMSACVDGRWDSITSDPALVTCGNCVRTHAYRTLLDEIPEVSA